MKEIWLVMLLFALSATAKAQLKTASLFGNHMVLQRDKPLPVWGWAAKNTDITVQLNGVSVKAKAGATGKWLAILPAMQAGGPYEIKISGQKTVIQYTDVMIGEVWICSGQSNMEFKLKDAYGFKLQQNIAPAIQVRQFAVGKELSLTPINDLPKSEWVASNAATVGDFTAVGYYFAKELAQKLHITIGLINASWGGAQIEGFLSKGAMLSSPQFKDYAASLPTSWEEADKRKDELLKRFVFKDGSVDLYTGDDLAKKDIGFFEKWFEGYAPGSWDWQGKYVSYRGKAFMQKTVMMNADAAQKKCVLALAEKDGYADIYINGKLIKGLELQNSLIELPAGTWKTGANNLLLHLSSQKEPAWFNAGIYGEKQNLFIKFDDTTISLADNKWRLMPDFKQPYTYEKMNNRVGTTLFNTMIYPLIPFAMQGVIWYQGESNAGRAYQYRTAFPLLINDWRNQWKHNFPFLFVQLSSFGEQLSSNEGSGWAELREAQTMALSLPNTGMAVTTDIGDADNVHPRNKEDVGKRLAAKALNDIYKIKTPFAGPLYKSVQFTNGKAIIRFDDTGSGLLVKDKYGYLKAFEIAGADKKFYYARATLAGEQVIVWSEAVPAPVAVRYGWTNAPIETNLFNREGFPASTFRTDNWKGVTEDSKFE